MRLDDAVLGSQQVPCVKNANVLDMPITISATIIISSILFQCIVCDFLLSHVLVLLLGFAENHGIMQHVLQSLGTQDHGRFSFAESIGWFVVRAFHWLKQLGL